MADKPQIVDFPLSVRYALKGLLFLASRPPRHSFNVEEIAKKQGLPGDFLGKIFQKLANAGILASKRGPGGGYWLLLPPQKIRLSEIVELFAPEDSPDKICSLGLGTCGKNPDCPFHPIMQEAERRIRELLQKFTLEDLMKLPSGAAFKLS